MAQEPKTPKTPQQTFIGPRSGPPDITNPNDPMATRIKDFLQQAIMAGLGEDNALNQKFKSMTGAKEYQPVVKTPGIGPDTGVRGTPPPPDDVVKGLEFMYRIMQHVADIGGALAGPAAIGMSVIGPKRRPGMYATTHKMMQETVKRAPGEPVGKNPVDQFNWASMITRAPNTQETAKQLDLALEYLHQKYPRLMAKLQTEMPLNTPSLMEVGQLLAKTNDYGEMITKDSPTFQRSIRKAIPGYGVIGINPRQTGPHTVTRTAGKDDTGAFEMVNTLAHEIYHYLAHRRRQQLGGELEDQRPEIAVPNPAGPWDLIDKTHGKIHETAASQVGNTSEQSALQTAKGIKPVWTASKTEVKPSKIGLIPNEMSIVQDVGRLIDQKKMTGGGPINGNDLTELLHNWISRDIDVVDVQRAMMKHYGLKLDFVRDLTGVPNEPKAAAIVNWRAPFFGMSGQGTGPGPDAQFGRPPRPRKDKDKGQGQGQ